MLLLPIMASAETVEIDGIFYNLVSKAKEAEVTKRANGYYSGAISIPRTVYYGGVTYTVSRIGDDAFNLCNDLTSVSLTENITSIGQMAFCGCTSLRSMAIPNNVNVIGFAAFKDCSNLSNVNIPNSLTIIDGYTFRNCKNLASLTIPNSVKEIGCCAFEGCSSITSVTIPDNVISLGRIENSILAGSTFKDCTSLQSVIIGNGVNIIHQYSFSGCNSLKTVTVGRNIKRIGIFAFEKCSNLESFYCSADILTNSELDSNGLFTYGNAFEGSYTNYATLHVPTSAINSYMATEPWSGFGNIVGFNSGNKLPKCETPYITYRNGELTFSCETSGVEYVYEITNDDVKKGKADKVKLDCAYWVSVYAKKEGYEDSDVATMVINMGNIGNIYDVNKDGAIDIADISTIIRVMSTLSRMQEEDEE